MALSGSEVTTDPTAPLAPPLVTEATISTLVQAFYARARLDPLLGPVFEAAIGDDWDAHMLRIRDFWSSVLLKSGRYQGTPLAVHAALDDIIGAGHFVRWLELFRQTAREVCPEATAALFIDRAERIAESLRLGMAFHAGRMD